MRKLIFMFLVLSFGFHLVNCGNGNDQNGRVQRRGARGASPTAETGPGSVFGNNITPTIPGTNNQTFPGQTQSQLGNSSWGKVVPQASNISMNGAGSAQSHPSTVVRFFLSTDYRGEDVGSTTSSGDDQRFNMPCSQGQSCGVAMCIGSNCGQGGTHQPLRISGNQLTSTSDSGGIAIGFWDSLTGRRADDGHVISPIPLYVPIDLSRSTIQNNQLNLIFSDSAGDIQVVGTVSGNVWSGQINFANRVYVDESGSQVSGGARGTLGTFQINVCSVVACN